MTLMRAQRREQYYSKIFIKNYGCTPWQVCE
jgi:hypothetical protein